MGKKNLEVRPLAVNKGEIVKRILYFNPDAEFIFCAGDDKTDEDMFRALLLFPQTQPQQPQAQRDERVWGADAWKWRPERWLYGDADAKAGPGAALLDDEARYPGVYSGM